MHRILCKLNICANFVQLPIRTEHSEVQVAVGMECDRHRSTDILSEYRSGSDNLSATRVEIDADNLLPLWNYGVPRAVHGCVYGCVAAW